MYRVFRTNSACSALGVDTWLCRMKVEVSGRIAAGVVLFSQTMQKEMLVSELKSNSANIAGYQNRGIRRQRLRQSKT